MAAWQPTGRESLKKHRHWTNASQLDLTPLLPVSFVALLLSTRPVLSCPVSSAFCSIDISPFSFPLFHQVFLDTYSTLLEKSLIAGARVSRPACKFTAVLRL